MLKRILLSVMTCVFVAMAPTAFAGAYEDIVVAARDDRSDTVIDLVRRGMDANTSDRSGTTLLMMAAANGNIQLLEFLLKSGANILKQNRYGDTALAIAALQGRDAIVQRLVQAGAPIKSDGWNPLHYAAFSGHVEIAKYLIGKQAPIDATAPNGQTALMLAARNGHLAVIKALVDADADLEHRRSHRQYRPRPGDRGGQHRDRRLPSQRRRRGIGPLGAVSQRQPEPA